MLRIEATREAKEKGGIKIGFVKKQCFHICTEISIKMCRLMSSLNGSDDCCNFWWKFIPALDGTAMALE